MAFNLFEAPEYYQGLLGEEATKKLQNKALTTGLVNAAIGYLAQPKTGGYGSALPYLGRALAGGLQAGQETIRSGLTDYETQQKIAEMKRKQEQQQALQGMIGGITDPNEKLFAQLAPEQYVAAKVKPAESPFAKIDQKDYTPESFAKYLQSGLRSDLLPITKEGGLTNDRDATAFELYAKPFNQLSQAEAGTVNKRVEQISANKAPKVSVNLSDPTAKAKAGIDLSERASKFYQQDVDTANQFQVITDLAKKNPNATGDTTLLYTYFKVLDPTSTVREGEIQMVKDSRSIPDKFKAYAQRLAGGGSLNQTERDEIYRQAEMKVQSRKKQVDKTRKAWVDNAKRLELDPNLYVPDPYGETRTGGKVEVDY